MLTNKMMRTLGTVSVLALSLSSTSSYAQDASVQNPSSNAGLDEIIVTAQRTSQNLQSTPVSVTAFNSEALERFQIDDAKDVSQVAPNVLIYPVTGGSAGLTPFIRGGGTTDGATITSEPEVGIYIDGIYQPSTAASFLGALDIDRIEVLRGPQGTLYGRNTSSGALKIETRLPGEELRIKGEVGIGTWDEYFGKLVASGPLTDDGRLRGGISGTYRTRDGGRQTNTSLGKDVGAEDYGGFQANLYYEGDKTTARLTGFYSDYNSDGTYASAVDPSTTSTDFDNLPFTSGSIETVLSPAPASTNDSNYGVNLNIKTEITPDIEFTSLTSWQKLNNDWRLDFSGGVALQAIGVDAPRFAALFDRSAEGDQTALSQEFQLNGTVLDGKLEFVTGLYYFRQDGQQAFSDVIFFGPNVNTFEIETDSYAAFGQATYRVTPDLGITVGARYTEDRKSIDALVGGDPVDRSDTFTNFLPKLAIEYQALPELLVYGSFTKGFKSGGYNGLGATTQEVNSPFDSQVVTAYEAGFKSEFFDRRVRLNVATFLNNTDDLQQQAVSDAGVFFTENYDSEHLGIESELTVQVTPNLTVWGNGTYNDAEYSGGSLFSGNRPTHVFKYQATVGADYGFDVGNGRVGFGANYNYRTDYFASPDNAIFGHVPDVGLVDAYMSYTQDNWKLRLAGKNLSNELYYTTGFGFGPIRPRFFADPVTYRLSLSYTL